jgi:hypothetical protein
MEKNFTFRFSAEEVNARTTIDAKTGVFRFVKTTDKIPDKLPYSKLLCDKVAEVVPAETSFSVEDPLRKGAKDDMRCYVKCLHTAKTSPVVFQGKDLKENHELEFVATIKCLKCLNVEASSSSSTVRSEESVGPATLVTTTSSRPVPSVSSSGFPFAGVGIQRDNILSPLFDRGSFGANNSLYASFGDCLAAADPKTFFYQHREEIAEKMKLAFLAQTVDELAIYPLEVVEGENNQLNEDPIPLPPPPPPATASFMQLSRQAQRQLESQANKGAKKRKTADS